MIFKEFLMCHVVTISSRLPRSLEASIKRLSKRDGCSINQFVAMAAAEKLAALEAEDYFFTHVARASLSAFDRIMSRAGGEPPREGDEQ